MRQKLSLMLLLAVLTICSLFPDVYASSTGQVVVAPSGQAIVTLTYTGTDFQNEYSNYTSNGETWFRNNIVESMATLGWVVEANSISFNLQQAGTMSISFPVSNLAQKTDSKWQILLGPLKPIYVNWSRTDSNFLFTSQVKPSLPLPESFSLQLPPNSVDVQFDSSNYIVSYQASGCIVATAAYGSALAPEVVYMRNVRDNMIGSNEVGKKIVIGWNDFYYSWSPQVAEFIHTYDTTKPIFRVLLLPLVGTVHLTAITYDTISLVNTSLASVVAFLIAALSSISVYMICPIITVRLIYRSTKPIR